MTQDIPEPSDDEIIAREKRKYRNAIISALVFWPLVTGAVILLFAIQGGAFSEAGITRNTAAWLLRGFPLLMIVLVWLLYWRFRPAREALTDRIQRKRIDEIQGRNRVLLVIQTMVAGLGCFGLAHRGTAGGLYMPVMIIVFLMLMAGVISFGQGWLVPRALPARDDELACALRLQATRIGYLVLMAALGAIYLAQIFQPALAPLLVRSALFAGIAAPAVCYLFLEWRAGRSG